MQKILFLLLFLSLNCFAQNKTISLEKITTSDKMFTGRIDDKYEITLYLKKYQMADDHLGVYSVKGWYYYDKYKKNIPLVGVQNPVKGLTLYALKDKSIEENILKLNYSGNIWDITDSIENISNYSEKFIISDSDENNVWISNGKTSKLAIYNLSNLFLLENYYFLKLNNDKINLSNFSLNYESLEIVATKKESLETRILLKYAEPGNHNLQGMCGGASDFGYIILSFNDKNELLQFDELEIENCRMFQYSEELESNSKTVIKYKITMNSGDKEIVRKVTVNKESITFIK
jgi:hypothetical protein